MPKKGCTYSRSSKGKCRSMAAHYAYTNGSGKKKGTCSYGRYPAGRCRPSPAALAKAKAKRMSKK